MCALFVSADSEGDRDGIAEKERGGLGRDGVPHPRVFFVRVANKGVMLDAASRMATAGRKVVLFSGCCRWRVPLERGWAKAQHLHRQEMVRLGRARRALRIPSG
jgi:hypothetical protein